MTSKPVAFLLADLGVTKTHSRPHVSDDNPYSEAHFKTLKYRPDFPERFGCIEDSRPHCGDFFRQASSMSRLASAADSPVEIDLTAPRVLGTARENGSSCRASA